MRNGADLRGDLGLCSCEFDTTRCLSENAGVANVPVDWNQWELAFLCRGPKAAFTRSMSGDSQKGREF